MTCTSCGDKPKGSSKGFPRAVVEINNPESLVLLRKVVIPVSMGTEEDVPPAIGKYFNVLLQYESNGHIYLYSSDGIPTAIEANIPQEVLDRIDQLEIDVDLLETGLANETEARETADTALGGRIDTVANNLATETANRISADEDLQADIAAEATARANGDAALNTAITSEVTARQEADTNLQNQITQETQARAAADTAINGAITAEASTRQTADAGLQSQIDAITASSDVKDIVGTKAELNNYDTSTLGNNDIIKVLQDESENDATTYYRWNATTQQFTLIGEEGPYYTKSQADTLLNAKQNTLTAGSNVQIVNDTISATDTTYTAGTGINISNGVISATSTGPTVVQTTGTSTTDVMSQNATTSMIYADPGTNQKIRISNNLNSVGVGGIAIGISSNNHGTGGAVAIGQTAITYGASSVALGQTSTTSVGADLSVAIGRNANASKKGSIALGAYSGDTSIDSNGMVHIGTSQVSYGYNNSNYRLLSGLYDGQNDHDAATKGQLDSIAIQNAGAPTTATVGTVGQLLEDTTNGKLYICTDATNPYVWEEVGSGGGGGPTVVQTTGTSTTDVMSQNAVTSMVFDDPGTKQRVQIGNNADVTGDNAIAIGRNSNVQGANGSVALGFSATIPANKYWSVALGANSSVTSNGEVSFGGPGVSGLGYNNSNYRLLTNVYDPQSAHDAATKGYVDNSLLGKQDALTAGSGISITDESGSLVISATGGGGGLDPNTTFWGQTAINGAVTGRITFGTNGYVNGTNSTVTVYADTAGGADPFEFSHTGFDVASKKITNLAAPTANGDAATKGYVDTAVAGAGASAFTTNEWNALWA